MTETQPSKSELSAPRRTPTTAHCLPDGTLIELLYDPARRATALCVWHDDRASVESEVLLGQERLVPFSPDNNIIRNGVVLLHLSRPNTAPKAT